MTTEDQNELQDHREELHENRLEADETNSYIGTLTTRIEALEANHEAKYSELVKLMEMISDRFDELESRIKTAETQNFGPLRNE
jgi:predicted nuclease with TOPRIM domain